MTFTDPAFLNAVDAAPRTIGARTLAAIRWVALAGQVATLLVVRGVLNFEVPLALAMTCVGISAILNLMLQARAEKRERIGDREATAYQAFDILQLTALLYVTGGLENPFALLLLAPVTVSATILSRRSTINLCVLALLCTTALGMLHLPLPWTDGGFTLPDIYVAGTWVAISVALIFNAAYAWWIAEESRRISAALSATQDALAREQRLAAIGGLAAAAAHELGSPLGTIAVAAKELARELPADSDLADDARLLVAEAERCRVILASLSRRSNPETDSPFTDVPMEALVEEAAGPYFRDGVEVIVEAHDPGDQDELSTGHPPRIPRSPEVLHGVGLLAQNAIQFASRTVEISVAWTEQGRTIIIADDGPGYSDQVLPRLGEPYLSGRADRGDNRSRPEPGMGLGVFIAKTLLERTGARLIFSNRLDGGAQVVIDWPRGILRRRGISGKA
jgi:two-component system sensor histidine kinase RegB